LKDLFKSFVISLELGYIIFARCFQKYQIENWYRDFINIYLEIFNSNFVRKETRIKSGNDLK